MWILKKMLVGVNRASNFTAINGCHRVSPSISSLGTSSSRLGCFLGSVTGDSVTGDSVTGVDATGVFDGSEHTKCLVSSHESFQKDIAGAPRTISLNGSLVVGACSMSTGLLTLAFRNVLLSNPKELSRPNFL